jgi:hypothetical protein
MPDWMMDGVSYPGRETSLPIAGLMFYDGEGNECGGLTYTSGIYGGHHTQWVSLTFDAYQQDQTIQVISDDTDGHRRYGLQFADHPERPITEDIARVNAFRTLPEGPEKEAARARLQEGHASRAFFGRQHDGTMELALHDGNGRPRLRMTVGLGGDPALEFLDAAGHVTYRLAPESPAPCGDASPDGAEGGSA